MSHKHGGTYIILTTHKNDDYLLDIGCLEQLESEFETYVNQVPVPYQYVQDKMLNLPTLPGGNLTIPVSAIGHFTVSSEETRERYWEFNRAVTNHKRQIWPEE